MAERSLTPVIASHNLRELEDICDHIGLLHKGGILLSQDLEELKLGIHKMQCAFATPKTAGDFQGIEIVSLNQRGSLYTIIAKGDRQTIKQQIQLMEPIFYELLPLTLEEIFINETEVAGYDIKKLIF